MTAYDRTDRLERFERELRGALRDAAGSPATDYLPDVLVRTVATGQRPAWTFISRWIPMSVSITHAFAPPRVPWRALAVAALLVILIGGVLLLSGSRHSLPPPFGRAANGLVAVARGGDISTIDPVTGTVVALTSDAAVDSDPAWSRDGAALVFRRAAAGGDVLVVMAPDGSGLRVVTPQPMANIRGVSYSPDGREIAFVAGGDTSGQLWVAPAVGSGLRRLDVGFAVSVPVWRPGGSEIVFVGTTPGDPANGLYAVDARSGSVRTLLAPQPGVADDVPTISPDGRLVAYSHVDLGVADANSYQVHLVGIDGTGDQQLPAPRGAVFQDKPTWSNDGTRLAIVRGYSAHNQDVAVAIIPADGSGTGVETRRRITGCCDNQLDWSPSDDSIVLLPEDLDGAVQPQILIDPATGATSTPRWSATSEPAYQRRAP
jgi:Tol biopolymer transport system component